MGSNGDLHGPGELPSKTPRIASRSVFLQNLTPFPQGCAERRVRERSGSLGVCSRRAFATSRQRRHWWRAAPVRAHMWRTDSPRQGRSTRARIEIILLFICDMRPRALFIFLLSCFPPPGNPRQKPRSGLKCEKLSPDLREIIPQNGRNYPPKKYEKC